MFQLHLGVDGDTALLRCILASKKIATAESVLATGNHTRSRHDDSILMMDGPTAT